MKQVKAICSKAKDCPLVKGKCHGQKPAMWGGFMIGTNLCIALNEYVQIVRVADSKPMLFKKTRKEVRENE